MPDTKTSIFVIGATGYIGGSLLSRLLTHPNAKAFDFTVIVRSPEKAKKFEQFGVKAVVGSTNDRETLESLVEQAHIVLSIADADDLEAMKTILSGMKKRHEKSGDVPILIHTSGSAIVADNALGMFASETIFDDTNIEQIESLPPTAFHRNVDLTVVDADLQGYIKSYIVVPSTVYGIASNPLVDAGIQNPYSVQVPALIKVSLVRGQGGVVGKGEAIWNEVHIDDLTELYITILDAILSNPDTAGHGREGYYFVENGQHAWNNICNEIAKVLFELGLGKSPEPTQFNTEELVNYFGSELIGNSFGSNSCFRASRGRLLGWKPKYTTLDLIADIRAEVEAIIKKEAQK